MGCQKPIAAQIKQRKGDDVLAVKGNQKYLAEEIKDFFDVAHQRDFKNVPYEYVKETCKSHGRIERRQYWVSTRLKTLSDKQAWKGLTSIGIVETRRTIEGHTSTERRYFITSSSSTTDELGSTLLILIQSIWSRVKQ